MAKIYYADLWGLREGKYRTLAESDIAATDWVELKPTGPFYLFVPFQEELLAEYEKGWKVTDIFPVNSVGIVTARDHFVLDYDAIVLKERLDSFRETILNDEAIKERLELADKQGWDVARARKAVREDKDWEKSFTKCFYRPFDIRPLFYHKSVIERSRPEIMRHMLAGENLGLLVPRQVVGDFHHVFCSSFITNFNALDIAGRFGSGCLFPLYLYPTRGEMRFEGANRHPNLNPEFIRAVSGKLELRYIKDGKGDLTQTFGPEDIFNYAYAVFHSPTYRTRYAEFLKINFPHLPLTSDKGLFKSLAAKGAELVSLHLMESPVLNNFITRYPIADSNTVEKVTYVDNNQRIYINKAQYFEGVSSEVWTFHIGGYQVAQKWLKDRKGRTLTYDELTHYQKVIVALKETIRLMREIDNLKVIYLSHQADG
ncbi:MAG TPA: DNA methyltransferase, partial [Chloroflexi bacterium]|nr:DNA methyltransferase [Chloroflexota bacterium]